MPKGGIGGIPIPPIGGAAAKAPPIPGPPIPGIGGAGKARGNNWAYMFCNTEAIGIIISLNYRRKWVEGKSRLIQNDYLLRNNILLFLFFGLDLILSFDFVLNKFINFACVFTDKLPKQTERSNRFSSILYYPLFSLNSDNYNLYMRVKNISCLPATDMGKQSQSCCSSRQARGQHPPESNRSKQIDMMQSTPSFPAI